MCVKIMKSLFTVQFITNQLKFMAVLLKKLVTSPFEEILVRGFYHMDIIRKTELPNIFSCTAFKKHISFLIDQNQNQAKFSEMFFYLPSTLDRKEAFLQWKEHVHLHRVDLSLDDMKAFTGIKEINPALLENIISGYYKLMKKIAEVSNQI